MTTHSLNARDGSFHIKCRLNMKSAVLYIYESLFFSKIDKRGLKFQDWLNYKDY